MTPDGVVKTPNIVGEWRTGIILAACHAALGFACWTAGLSGQDADSHAGWDWFWQMIPVADMQSHPWATLWQLHYQPPGYSLWGLFWLNLAGAGLFPQSIHFANILLGAAIILLGWRLALNLSASRGLALAAGLALAVDPSLLLFEAYYLYDMFVTALVVGSAGLLWRTLRTSAAPRRNWPWLAGFILILNYLVMTRSLFHWVFLWVALLFALPAWQRIKWTKRILLFAFAILVPGLWYAKSLRDYGFFGASSWFGIGFYKCVMVHYNYYELRELEAQGVIPHYVMERSPYQHTPADYRIFGFDRPSNLPTFARDDFRNINMPDISKGYEKAAKAMVRRHPDRYLQSMLSAYVVFSNPPSAFDHLFELRIGALGTWEAIVTNIVFGKALTDQIQIFTGRELGSMVFFLFPVLMLFGIAWSARKFKADRIRAMLMLYFVFVCTYVAVVGNMFEIGENMRFRLATTPFTHIIALMALRACWNRIPAGVRAKLRPKLK